MSYVPALIALVFVLAALVSIVWFVRHEDPLPMPWKPASECRQFCSEGSLQVKECANGPTGSTCVCTGASR